MNTISDYQWVFGAAVQPVFVLNRGSNRTCYQTGPQGLAVGPTKKIIVVQQLQKQLRAAFTAAVLTLAKKAPIKDYHLRSFSLKLQETLDTEQEYRGTQNGFGYGREK